MPVRQLAPLFNVKSYNLILDLTRRSERQFSGQVEIKGDLLQGGQILLHAKDLAITKALINGDSAKVTVASEDELRLGPNSPLKPGPYTASLWFEAPITDAMQGLYPSYYQEDGQTKEILSTQLESHSAREVFPCIDEPAAKAVFKLTLKTESGQTVLSNMPPQTQTTENGVLTTVFEPSPKMSTYLLALAVGDLEFTEAISKHGVKIRAYATKSNIKNTNFALELAAKLLDYYDDFFGVAYPLPKCDLLCIPDFSAAAMENWGLIIGRESSLLIDGKHSSLQAKKWVAEVVTHELAHQWFGNLVTMRWWDDLWLNESFAKWMEYYALDYFYPEWKIWEQFGGSERLLALTRDSSAKVQAVRSPVNHPDELHSLFDPAIVYAKGSCLIRMLQNFVGQDEFRDGLRTYMKRHAYGNADANDLWEAIQDSSGQDVTNFMLPWLNQPGHPVVHAGISGGYLHLKQERFLANPHATDSSSLWPIPLLSNQIKLGTLEERQTKTHPEGQKPLLLNKSGGGFYHVNYQSNLLEDLQNMAKDGTLEDIDRQILVADCLALASAGHIGAASLLRLISSLKEDKSYAVWQSIAAAMESLRLMTAGDSRATANLQRFAAEIAARQFQRLGWEIKKSEPYFDTLLRPIPLGLLGFGKDPAMAELAAEAVGAAVSPVSLPAETRTAIMSAALRHQGRPVFNKLLSWYKMATGEQRQEICIALAALPDQKLAAEATKLFKTDFIKPQDLRFWFTSLMRNPTSSPLAWDWMKTNWPWIKETFKNGHEYGDFPKYAAAGFATKQGLQEYEAFFGPKQQETELKLTVGQGLDEISARTAWRERDLQSILELP